MTYDSNHQRQNWIQSWDIESEIVELLLQTGDFYTIANRNMSRPVIAGFCLWILTVELVLVVCVIPHYPLFPMCSLGLVFKAILVDVLHVYTVSYTSLKRTLMIFVSSESTS